MKLRKKFAITAIVCAAVALVCVIVAFIMNGSDKWIMMEVKGHGEKDVIYGSRKDFLDAAKADAFKSPDGLKNFTTISLIVTVIAFVGAALTTILDSKLIAKIAKIAGYVTAAIAVITVIIAIVFINKNTQEAAGVKMMYGPSPRLFILYACTLISGIAASLAAKE